jgi:thiol-disulfide isomerase/thioredoxin
MIKAFLLIALVTGRWSSYGEAYESYQKGRPMVVLLGASWCGPCKAAEKELEAIGSVSLVKLDIESNSDAKLFPAPSSVPVIYLFRPGKKPVLVTGNRVDMIRRALNDE